MSLDGAATRRGLLSSEVWEKIRPFIQPGPSQVLVIQSADCRTGSAILSEIAERRLSPGVVVITPEQAGPGVPLDRTPPRLPSSWWALRTTDELAPIAATAAALSLIHTLVREAGNEPMVPALWLPPPLLEGYSLLPQAPEVTLAVDCWDGLLEAYLRGRHAGAGGVPSEEDLERILLESSEDYLTVHLIILTRRSHRVLESGADFVLRASEATRGAAPEVKVQVNPRTPGRSGPPH
jgi:hypothetical protein